MNVKIDESLLASLEEHRKETPFRDIHELVDFIIRDYLLAQKAESSAEDGDDELDKRLRDLGYM